MSLDELIALAEKAEDTFQKATCMQNRKLTKPLQPSRRQRQR